MPATTTPSLLDAIQARSPDRIGRTPDGKPFVKGMAELISTRRTKLSAQRVEKLCAKRKIPYRRGLQARVIDFIGSDETLDRAGDIIRVDGWITENYEKNPVFLWCHDYLQPPIGTCLEVAREGIGKSEAGEDRQGLRFSMLFADAKTYPFADQIFRLYKGGHMRATSVGFNPIEGRQLTDEDLEQLGLERGGATNLGNIFSKQELLELSAVPIPCNPNALQMAYDKGIVTAQETRSLAMWLPASIRLLRQVETKLSMIELEDEFSYRIRDPEEFDAESFDRMPWMETEQGPIELMVGMLTSGEKAVQSARFPKAAGWTEETASAWAMDHQDDLANATPPEAPAEAEPEKQGEEGDMGPEDGGPEQVIQALVFDGEKFSPEEATAWATDNGFEGFQEPSQDEGTGEITIVVEPLEDFDADTMETVDVDDGVRARVGMLATEAPTPTEESAEPPPGKAVVIRRGGEVRVRVLVENRDLLDRLEQLELDIGGLRAEMAEMRSGVGGAREPSEEPETDAQVERDLVDALLETSNAIE